MAFWAASCAVVALFSTGACWLWTDIQCTYRLQYTDSVLHRCMQPLPTATNIQWRNTICWTSTNIIHYWGSWGGKHLAKSGWAFSFIVKPALAAQKLTKKICLYYFIKVTREVFIPPCNWGRISGSKEMMLIEKKKQAACAREDMKLLIKL